MTYDYAVFIGRFQPFHAGHEYVIRQALTQAKQIIVLVGSAAQARDSRNPFTYEERVHMITNVFGKELINNTLLIAPLPDIRYNDVAWIRSVQSIVAGVIGATVDEKKIALTGFGKDASSYYLKMFPEWGSINVESQFATYNSTDIRKAFLKSLPSVPSSRVMHPNNIGFLGDFSMTPEFKSLVDEAKYLEAYGKQWGRGPFITVDAVVIQSGHILLVTRGDNPGKGLLALPGGFVNRDEQIKKAAVRELMEETRLCDNKGEMPPAVLASYMQEEHTKIFDDPDRSLRGRIITFAHLFKLPDSKKLWKVTGSDDAADARWYRLGDLRSEDFFEDHWHIINGFIGAGI